MAGTPESALAFHVSVSGSATGDGSAANPFATLQQAQHAMETSTIKTTYVEAGTYNLSSTLTLGSADSGESFIAAPGQQVTLDGGKLLNNLISLNGANNVTVSGFTLQNTNDNAWTN